MNDDQFIALKADAKLSRGERLKAKWGSGWLDVEVLEVLPDGKVKIRWVGWSDSWDEIRDVTTLSRPKSDDKSKPTASELKS